MHNRGMMVALALAASLGAVPMASAAEVPASIAWDVAALSPARRRRALYNATGFWARKYRSRWKAQRRTKRSNMNHVSKRTRRRHRRANRA